MPLIEVNNLIKEFTSSVKNPEHSAVRNFLWPQKKLIRAVDNITFAVNKGESVALIGPNGAGKSTTIKMLTGILYPTSGSISVDGLIPQKNRRELAFRIGTLFGQRSQLVPNLPIADSFELFGALYEIPNKQVKRRAAELIELFQLQEFMDRPVRKLSLGERMRAEIAIALLHEPEIIFLDEPTIGLDIVAKKALRQVLTRLNTKEGVTLFLTSHDAGDIEALCARTIIINHGQIIVDEQTEQLTKKFFTKKHVRADLLDASIKPQLIGVKTIKKSGAEISFSIDTDKQNLNSTIKELLDKYDIEDLDISNPTLEEVITAAYGAKR